MKGAFADIWLRAPVWLRRAAAVVVAVSFLLGFALMAYLVHLDGVVRERFEGVLFRVPSQVYAAPEILYPGLDWKLVDLRGTLLRLGYREADSGRALPPGQFVWSPHRVRVHLRSFEHPNRQEPSRDVVLRLGGRTIREMRSVRSGEEIGAVLLEPERIGAYYGSDREQRELVALDELPQHMTDAVLAVEDQRFESHVGIDLRRIAGAMLANLRAGGIREGGSTLTQQLVKNFFLTPERTLSRKLQEALMALLVEARYDKDQILESYLNEIYLGQRGATAIHGIGEASRSYFGKSASRLSVAEAGLLAAIIQSPNGISPYRDPERAVARRNLVLDLMRDQDRISADVYEQARQEPLRLAAITPDANDARYFLDLLQRQLVDTYPADALTGEGVKIYSSLDRRLQRLGADALRHGIERIEARVPALHEGREGPAKLQGCLVALRPRTGELVALVGGRDYRISQFDRCVQAKRQSGSVFKPFVYIAALQPVGDEPPTITLGSFLDDSPLSVETRKGPWTPRNYDGEFHDTVGVREALERSLNVATARLAQNVGIERVRRVAKDLGIESYIPPVPSVALGTAEVSPLEVARAYATIASGGLRPEVQAIEDVVDQDGQVLERRRLQFERVLSPGLAYLATSLLEGVALRGTAAGVRAGGLTGPIAAKTGTTDEERDLWFVGFTPDLVAVVWLGFDEPSRIGVPSSVGAMPIWREFVQGATGGTVRGVFPRPHDVERVEIEPKTGALALSGCRERRREYFLAGTLPEHRCPSGGSDEDAGPGRFFRWLRERL
jgi:penicillin-binding protein 1B